MQLKVFKHLYLMSLKEKLSEKSQISEELLPSRYQIIGDILLAKLFYLNKKEKKEFAKAAIKVLPYIKTVCEVKQIKGEYRKPKIVKLLGKSTETTHKENNVFFKLDVSKIMFSKGNLLERKRLLDNVQKNEVIIDMFAGIGYFSLPLSKKCKKIYAIEKNPISFKYLKQNIKLNKLDNIKPILADCRKLKIKEKADRIIMGYFPHTEKYLKSSMNFLKDKGIIHYHNLYNRNDLIKPLEDVEKAPKKANFKIISFKQRTVKSYNPKKDHVVLDIELEKIS